MFDLTKTRILKKERADVKVNKFFIEEIKFGFIGEPTSKFCGYWNSVTEALAAARKKYLEEETHLGWEERGTEDSIFFVRENEFMCYESYIQDCKEVSKWSPYDEAKVVIINEI